MRCLVLLLLIAAAAGPVRGQAPARYESTNFTLSTDLPEEKAEELLEKLETMLGIISRYWAVPNRQKIECVVVANLKNWPAGSIDPRALGSIQTGGGITLADYRRRGNRTSIRAVAYAVARTGTVQHEAVHAYSYYAFGTCGPQWYAEGMAEMGSHWVEGETKVTAPRYVTEYLRRSERRSVAEITKGETARVGSWQNYAWRWALCHLLANNKNYARKFRPLGLSMLSRRKGSFSATYGNQMRELEFEYDFFLRHVQPGFDVSRCSWDWDTRFRKLKPGRDTRTSVRADAGWQATGVRVEPGLSYTFQADGSWQLTPDGEKLSADGDRAADGTGRLEAVVMVRRTLREPFPLGSSGTFQAKDGGDLYVRCKDAWNSLHDNSGLMTLQIGLPAATDEKSEISSQTEDK